MRRAEIVTLLQYLRAQAKNVDGDILGSHQLDAHWSLAFACNHPPEPWELYRAADFHKIPTTDFFATHPIEIQEALKPKTTWDLLHAQAAARIALEDGTSQSERNAHGHPGNVQYYDTTKKAWLSVDVRRIQWFDAREIYRKSVAQTKDELCARVDKRLATLRKRAREKPTQRLLEELTGYEKYVSGQFKINLKEFDRKRNSDRTYLAKLDRIPDFAKTVFRLLREAENEARRARGISAVGEAWIGETELLYRVRELLPGVEIIAHGQPNWLGRQHLDIWIPSLSVAIEYQGVQHFRSIEFFGGDEGFRRNQERDNKKRALCKKNQTRLLEIAYDHDIDDATLKQLIVPRS
jgi:hypothetical protein